MLKLDQKDRKIIAILSTDARATYSQIGKKIRLHKDSVAYRIRQLENKGIISGYTAFFNFSSLGYRVYKVYIKFRGLKQKEHEEIVNYIKNNPLVGWLVEGDGSWDMVIGIHTENLNNFYKFKLAFENEFSDKIAELSASTQIQAYLYPRSYIFNLPREEILLYSNKDKIQLDKKDKEILRELSINSRNTVIDIAKKTRLSERTVGYRIKQLNKDKIIMQYRASINLEKINYVFIKAFIKLQRITQDKLKEIISFFRNNDNVIHNVESLGEWEIEPEFEVENVNDFHKIMNEFRTLFSENIVKIDSMIINKEYKYNYVL